VAGRTGLCVARSVEEEFLTERENAFHLSAHILILDTTNVMEMIMKRKNVMNSVVQVCKPQSFIGVKSNEILELHRTSTMEWMGRMVNLQQKVWRWIFIQTKKMHTIQVPSSLLQNL